MISRVRTDPSGPCQEIREPIFPGNWLVSVGRLQIIPAAAAAGAGVLPSSAPLASAWWPSFNTLLHEAQLVFMCHQPQHTKQASFSTQRGAGRREALVTAQGAWGKSAESQSRSLW